LTGTAIGLVQDMLTHQPIGIDGIAKAILGYLGSSIGLQVDVENLITRIFMIFGFSCLESALLFLIDRYLLGIQSAHLLWLHESIRAALNTAVAIPAFFLLDRFKLRE
jgi:rod shape-determining protein MreD